MSLRVHAKVDEIKLATSKTVSELDLEDARGQSYDGCGAVVGKEKGVAMRIRKKFPKMSLIHCHSHRLNLCVMKVIKLAQVLDMFEHCRCISEFFGNSAKRSEVFAAILANSDIPKNEQKMLINICRTR